MQLSKNIELKYHLKIHKFLPSYPNKKDLLFDMIDKNYKEDKEELKFSAATIKQVYKESLKNEEFKNKIKYLINELIEEKKIITNGNFFIIQEQIVNSFIE